ncbi:MAG: L,D-transpeptidase family protein [Bacteroidales bacterium]|nr:L,D-transpeptidase family protein [Bacteroidales bacterium]
MYSDEKLLELDYPSPNKSRNFFATVFTYASLISFFILLSSYQLPTSRLNNKLVDVNSGPLQSLLEIKLKSESNQTKSDTLQDINKQINELLVKFYENREFKPAWINKFATNHQYKALINLLDSSNYYGFPFDYFNTERIHGLKTQLENNEYNYDFLKHRIDLELSATYSAFKFMIYLKHGIIEKDTSSDFLTYIETLPEILNRAVNQTNLKTDILSVQPDLVHHRNLLNSLPYFIDLHYSVKYTTPAFIDDKMLAKSLYYAGITTAPVFDSTNLKSDALFKLESQYQLPKDTLLNVPTHQILVSLLEYRYFQTCLNLNRLRILNHSGENYLFVNIPEFKLHVIESNVEKEAFNVIVGKKGTPTPIFSSNIEKVIANPYWTVPRSILSNEMLHKIRKDSTYLKRNRYFVINNYEERVDESIIDWNEKDPLGNKYWLRQMNSRYNALGQVKFIFPNNHSVYLHDTQSKGLFKRENRTFSHGCIRLENPDKLAQYLTDNFNTQHENDIERLISENERHVIDLSEKVKIHIQYITCSTTQNSDMIFYDDVYNLDKEEIMAIFPDQFEI